VDRDPYTVAIAPGEGLVVRFGDVVMYVADASAAVDRLMTAVGSVADTERPARAVAERLAALAFGAESASIPPFGVIAPTADGLLLLLRGAVTASVEAADGTREVSGARALTWVDEVLPESARKVTIGGRPGLAALPRTDLRAGVVPGGGFVLDRATAPACARPEPEPEPAVKMAETVVHNLAPVQPASPSVTQAVQPVGAPRGNPSETSMLAPVAGFLETEDGAVFPLDRPYVIGRDPLKDELVRNAHASPIVLQNDNHVSRVHAFVTIDGGAVFVRDATTPAGTFIAAPGAKSWTEITSTPTELAPGWSIRLGERVLTYRT
jgi:hypothetical protein